MWYYDSLNSAVWAYKANYAAGCSANVLKSYCRPTCSKVVLSIFLNSYSLCSSVLSVISLKLKWNEMSADYLVLSANNTLDLVNWITFNHGLRIHSCELSDFYRAMHFSAKRGIAIACRLSVRPSVCLSLCLSVCNVGELWSHRLEFFENNFTIS